MGVLLESFLVEGRQELGEHATLTYGQSVTGRLHGLGRHRLGAARPCSVGPGAAARGHSSADALAGSRAG